MPIEIVSDVLSHELAHSIHLEQGRGLVKAGRRIFGRAPFLFPNADAPTWMVEGNTKLLAPGFVFSVEPGIYMPGLWGVRIEDDFMCTENGGELLSRRAPIV